MDEWKEGWLSGGRDGLVEEGMDEWKKGGMSGRRDG